MNEREYAVVVAMESLGGNFVKALAGAFKCADGADFSGALAVAFRCADLRNRGRIMGAFPSLGHWGDDGANFALLKAAFPDYWRIYEQPHFSGLHAPEEAAR